MSDKDDLSEEECKEQDKFLPIANISRIMKKNIPPHGKVSKEAKEAVQECVTEFICFITSEASDRCMQEKRKTINGDDILYAMQTLGFERYLEPLKVYLQKYRETCRPSDRKAKKDDLGDDYGDGPYRIAGGGYGDPVL